MYCCASTIRNKHDIDTHRTSISLNHSLFLLRKKWCCCSLLGLFLITRLFALFLVFLLRGLLPVDVFESLEFFNEEGSHDSISDFRGSVFTTVGSADWSLGWSQSLEGLWSGNLYSLHASSLGMLSNQMKNKSTTYKRQENVRKWPFVPLDDLPGVFTGLKLLLLVLYELFLLYVILLSSIFRSLYIK